MGYNGKKPVRLEVEVYDSRGNAGAASSILVSTGAGVSWTAPYDAGLQGIQGLQGPQGTQGTQGLLGLQGTQGLQGSQGIQGSQGTTGTQGFYGIQGLTGLTGADSTVAGPQGTVGFQGVQGPQGTQGTQGTQGLQGLQGSQGTQGTQGSQGIIGSQPIAQTYTITVAGGVFYIDGVQQDTLYLLRGQKYVFDQSDSSNSSHPFYFSTTSDGTHNSGTQYTDGWTYSGSAGTDGEGVLVVPYDAPDTLYYYCGNHSGMGGSSVIKDLNADSLQGAQGTQGLQGTQGAQGLQGSQGTTGTQGFYGTQGTQGSQGTQGVQGETGTQGFIGSQGVQGIVGSFGGATFDYTFTTSTSGDPGQGKLGFNNANVTLATTLLIDDIDGTPVDIQTYLRTIDDSSSTIKGHFKISNKLDASDFAFFTISSVTEQSGYFEVSCAYVSGPSTSFSNNEEIIITFARTGDKGDTGLQGTVGTQGADGIQGFYGTQGTNGLQGTTGETGADSTVAGPQGTDGLQGTTGSGLQGTTGTQGADGIQGTDGLQGTTGTGLQGITGTQGATGTQGTDGLQGTIGETGADSTVAGPQGATGTQGTDGLQGTTGTGLQGTTGTQGATGTQGTNGLQGITGETGADSTVAGPQGATGTQGTNGLQGTTGETGADSTVAGPQGTDGLQGTTGASVQGTTGADSTVAGPQGSDGTQGTSGTIGVDGDAGPQGTDGTQGPEGTGTALTVQQIQGAGGTIDVSVTNVNTIQFDQQSGFAVTDNGGGEVFINFGSAFNPWYLKAESGGYVSGSTLDAEGEEELQFVAGNGIQLISNTTSSPKELKIALNGGGVQGTAGAQGSEGSFGGATFDYTFDSATANQNPGNGKLRLNNSNLSLATILYISRTDDAVTNISNYLNTVDDSTSTIKGHLKISNKSDPDNFVLYTISALSFSTYYIISVQFVSGSVSTFSDTDVLITFARTGDKGDIGIQGTIGPQGLDGIQGSPGSGSQGSDGAFASQGIQGTVGDAYPGHYNYILTTSANPQTNNDRAKVTFSSGSSPQNATQFEFGENSRFRDDLSYEFNTLDTAISNGDTIYIYVRNRDSTYSSSYQDTFVYEVTGKGTGNTTSGIYDTYTYAVNHLSGNRTFFWSNYATEFWFVVSGQTGPQGIQGNDGAYASQGIQGNDGVQGPVGAGKIGITYGYDGSSFRLVFGGDFTTRSAATPSLGNSVTLNISKWDVDNNANILPQFTQNNNGYITITHARGQDRFFINSTTYYTQSNIMSSTSQSNAEIAVYAGYYLGGWHNDNSYLSWQWTTSPQEEVGIHFAGSIQGIQGSDGVQGTFGIQGTDASALAAQGTDGAQGTTGSQGTAGSDGSDGSQGTDGTQGTTGTQGTAGSDGADGEDGADSTVPGPQGTTGSQGTTGETGADSTVAGPQGTTGSQGTLGFQGIQGVQGPQGLDGAYASQGVQGTEGVGGPGELKYTWDASAASVGEFTATFSTGSTANNATVLKFSHRQNDAFISDVSGRWEQLDTALSNGQTCYIGYRLTYPNGNVTDSVVWEVTGKSTGNTPAPPFSPSNFVYAVSKAWGNGSTSFGNYTGRLNLFSIILEGIQGVQGVTGAGVQGATGTQGFVGLQGNDGLGVQGADGAYASIGLQGITGAGLQGSDGAQGIQGIVGADSTVPGPQGTDGLQGTDGPQGTAGTIGVDGDPGSQGADGIQGITGVQGNLGAQGLDGAYASQGIQGVTGGAGQAGGVSFALAVALAAAL